MNSWDYWNQGTALSKAAIKYGDPDLVQSYNHHFSKNNGHMMLDRLLSNVERGAKGTDILKDVVGDAPPTAKILETLRNEVKGYLCQGNLVGYGFSSPRRIEDVPQKIPADLWVQRIGWEADKLTGQGLKIESIRIVDAASLNPEPTSPTLSNVETKSVGRPSKQDQIVEAFLHLATAGQIDFSRPKTECYPKVRNWVLENYPDKGNEERGIGVKALEKHINPLFDQEKKKSL